MHKNKQINIRLPDELRSWLKEESKIRYQPMNSIVVELIRKAKEEQNKCKV